MTYSESRNEAPFDWRAFLQSVTIDDVDALRSARDRAASWVTCAVGNQCRHLPRVNGAPLDSLLFQYGCDFHNQIHLSAGISHPSMSHFRYKFAKVRAAAIEILDKIEARAQFLLAEMAGPQERLPLAT